MALPEHVRLAMYEIAGAAKEGLLAISVGCGLAVMQDLMLAEVERVVGPKGRQIPQRTATRHDTSPGEVTLGESAWAARLKIYSDRGILRGACLPIMPAAGTDSPA